MSSKIVCNWCDRHTELAKGKPYCKDCDAKCFKECCRCHRPFNHPKYFQLDPLKTRCDACQRKLWRERKQAGTMKSKKIIESDSDSIIEVDTDASCDEREQRNVRIKESVPVKKSVVKRKPISKPRKKKICDQVEALKALICQWSEEEECMKRILDGKKMALVPIFF